jgi:hypothetical protein
MLEETTPRNSAKWIPHSTFAADLGMIEKSRIGRNHQMNGKNGGTLHKDLRYPTLVILFRGTGRHFGQTVVMRREGF